MPDNATIFFLFGFPLARFSRLCKKRALKDLELIQHTGYFVEVQQERLDC